MCLVTPLLDAQAMEGVAAGPGNQDLRRPDGRIADLVEANYTSFGRIQSRRDDFDDRSGKTLDGYVEADVEVSLIGGEAGVVAAVIRAGSPR